MFKMLLGAAIVVALVGYGVLTPETLEEAGDRMRTGINNGAAWVKDKTEPNAFDQIKNLTNN